MPKIEPEPLSKIAEAQWHEYMDARRTAHEAHKREKEEIRKNNELALVEVRAKQKAHKETAFATLVQYDPEFVGIARLLLSKQHREEMATARKELPKTPKLACGCFKEWLRQSSSNSNFIVYIQFLQNLRNFHSLGIANLQV